MKIGYFKPNDDQSYDGRMLSLTGEYIPLFMAPAERRSENGPDYRILRGDFEFGAAWKRTSKDGKAYLSVKLDAPMLPAPINAALIEAEGGYMLVWNRDGQKQDALAA